MSLRLTDSSFGCCDPNEAEFVVEGREKVVGKMCAQPFYNRNTRLVLYLITIGMNLLYSSITSMK